MLGAKESFQDDSAEGKNKRESYEQDGLRAGKLLGERCSFKVLLELFEIHGWFPFIWIGYTRNVKQC